jgi:hypothetical protein
LEQLKAVAYMGVFFNDQYIGLDRRLIGVNSISIMLLVMCRYEIYFRSVIVFVTVSIFKSVVRIIEGMIFKEILVVLSCISFRVGIARIGIEGCGLLKYELPSRDRYLDIFVYALTLPISFRLEKDTEMLAITNRLIQL